MDEGGSMDGASHSEKTHCGGPRRKAPLLCTLGYERKALGTDISLHGGSVGQPGVEPSTRDFDKWLKGALEVGCFSLWELCEGNVERGGPWRIGRKGSGEGHLFP